MQKINRISGHANFYNILTIKNSHMSINGQKCGLRSYKIEFIQKGSIEYPR